MKVDVWMPLFVADYLADTTHLDTELHGAYLLLLMSYWKRGAPLPDDDRQLAAMARMSIPRWMEARPVIEAFFSPVDNLWIHHRVESELASARERVEAASERARKAATARYGKAKLSTADDHATSQVSDDSAAPSMLQACSKQSSEHASFTIHLPPTTKHHSPGSDGLPAARLEARRAVWERYSGAFTARYGVEPTVNAKVRGQVARFCERVPIEEAPAIAEWYVRSSKRWYMQISHSTDGLLKDAEALRTDWLRQVHSTEVEAREADATQSRANAFGHLLAGAK